MAQSTQATRGPQARGALLEIAISTTPMTKNVAAMKRMDMAGVTTEAVQGFR